MRVRAKFLGPGALSILLFGSTLAAQAPPSEAVKPAAAQPTSQPLAAPRRFETNHEGVFGGQPLRYKAVVAENFITDSNGKRTASVFTTSFVRTDSPKGTARPVIFVFNGGPGSASLWLQMGFVGPHRIDFTDPVNPETLPPFRTVDNDDSPLDVADIVLIDPPGTGFSRILSDGTPEQFYGTAQDAGLSAELIQRWVRENDRWNAPKYLLAESYGTIRAAVVARLLAGGPTETGNMDGMTLNGIILLGQAMDIGDSDGSDIRYLELLPTLAATACYHGSVAASCTAAAQVTEATKFSSDVYLKALYAGSNLSAAERDAIVARLAELTGLSPTIIRENDLRISASAFARELLADKGKQIGLYDGRFTLPLAASGNDPVADDPAMAQYVPGFVAAYNIYTRHELGVSINDTYQAIAFRSVNANWDYGRGPGKGPAGSNYAADLAVAMRRNPHMRLMIGEGYYDLVTPIGAAEYTVSHAGIPLTATETHHYPSGHMPYLGSEGRQMLARDIRVFVTSARAANTP